METKYYTPTIEEFHVGFEYEYFSNKEWIATEFHEDFIAGPGLEEDESQPFAWKGPRSMENYRVKFLDREDIEACGWTLDSCVEGECFFEFNGSNLASKYDWGLMFREKEGTVNIFDRNERPDALPLSYYGFIRNKSELRRVMKMLNIE